MTIVGTDKDENKGRIFVSTEDESYLHDITKYKSLGHRLIEKLELEWANEVLFIDSRSKKEWTGSKIREKILNIAAGLIDLYSLDRQSVVCISFDHCDLTCFLALGVICAGGIVACAYSRDPYAELLYLAQKVEPKILFCHEENKHWGNKLENDLQYKVKTISMSLNLEDSKEFSKLLNYNHKEAKCFKLNQLPVPCKNLKKEICLITMSSGTTGKPKAVPASHWNCLNDLCSSFSRNRSGLTEIIFANTASLDYVSGRLIVLGSIESGYKVIIMNGFEVDKFCQAIDEYKINFCYLGAASFYTFITYEHLNKFDLTSIKCMFPMGAKIVYLKELREFFKKYPNIKCIRQGYGSSEASGVAMNTMTPEQFLDNSTNAGKLMASVGIKIVDPEDETKLLGYNAKGLISVRGTRTFPGYYDVGLIRQGYDVPFLRDENMFDEDGFYKTGDLAYINDKEELFIIGRQKELMNCRGSKKVLPQELEGLISEHPAVAEVCVLGIGNKRELTLHCPRAFIVPKNNFNFNFNELSTVTKQAEVDQEQRLTRKGEHKLCNKLTTGERHKLEESIMSFVDNNIGWEKQLTGGVVILDAVGTRGATGKVDKNYLRGLTTSEIEIYGDRSC